MYNQWLMAGLDEFIKSAIMYNLVTGTEIFSSILTVINSTVLVILGLQICYSRLPALISVAAILINQIFSKGDNFKLVWQTRIPRDFILCIFKALYHIGIMLVVGSLQVFRIRHQVSAAILDFWLPKYDNLKCNNIYNHSKKAIYSDISDQIQYQWRPSWISQIAQGWEFHTRVNLIIDPLKSKNQQKKCC